jgi:hypothetical protein
MATTSRHYHASRPFLPLLLLLLLLVVCLCCSVQSFTPSSSSSRCAIAKSPFGMPLSAAPKDNNNDNNETNPEIEPSTTPSSAASPPWTDRFTNPRLDDPGLPLTEAGLAQICAPSLQIAWLSLLQAPSPTWCQPLFRSQQLLGNGAGSLLAPTLIHGAALATCWLLGALAARAYERDAFAVDPVTKSYTTVVRRVLQAGCGATGILILATQADVYLHYGYIQFGDGPDTDFRLQVALVEGMQDVFFEGLTLISWRLFLARQSAQRL